MTIAVYPGSFDPVTLGHLDLITRAAGLHDKLIVAIGTNTGKTPVFSDNERANMIRDAVTDLPNVEVTTFSGMTVDFCKANGAKVLVRGVRGLTDLEAEIPMALTNRTFDETIETVFMVSAPEHGFVSSHLIRETAALGGSIDHLVPAHVATALYARLRGDSAS